MKIEQNTTSVIRSNNITNEATFSIKGTAKAFDILASGLYSDKILAIVRELSCNAYDSHVAAGKKDVPIEIRLPTHLDPTFYVKDFGTGLSHEQIAGSYKETGEVDEITKEPIKAFVPGIYQTFFDSNKTDSNDFIGALGLGSKSPFSYTDSFIVVSCHNGTKRTYSAFKNEEGLPSIVLMCEESTDECNGIQVTISVKPDDINKFKDAAKKALMYFSPLPNVVGRDDFCVHRLEHTIQGSCWKMRDSDYFAYMNGAYVVQGFVAYPVKGDTLREENNMSETAKQLTRVNIDLFVDIGKVEVAASREALSYNKTTINNLVQVLETVAVELRSSFQAEFDKCVTRWEAAALFDKIERGYGGRLKSIFKAMHNDKPFTWKNAPITEEMIGIILTGVKKTTISNLTTSHRKLKTVVSGKWHPDTTTTTTYSINVHNNLFVLVDSDAKGNADVIRQFLCSKSDVDGHAPRVLLLKPTTKANFDQAEINKIVSMMGDPVVTNVADLPFQKARTTSAYAKKDKSIKLIWKGESDNQRAAFSRLTWTNETVDMNAGGIYVMVKRFTPLLSNGMAYYRMPSNINHAVQLGLMSEKTQIVGLNEKDLDVVKNDPKWVHLDDYISSQFKKANANNSLINKAVRVETLKRIQRAGTWPTTIINNWASYVEPKLSNGAFKNYINAWLNLIDSDNQDVSASSVIALAEHYSTCNVEVIASNKATEWEQLISNYGMIQFINWNVLYQHTDLKVIIDYINMVDAKKPQVEELLAA